MKQKFIGLLTIAMLFVFSMQAQTPQSTPDSVFVFYSAKQLHEEYQEFNGRESYFIVTTDSTMQVENAFVITRWATTDDLGYYPDEKVIGKVSYYDITLWQRNESAKYLYTWISNTWETRQDYIYDNPHSNLIKTTRTSRLARDKQLVREQVIRLRKYQQ